MLEISHIQDWWNTLEEEEMRKVYQGRCKHNYIVQQVEGNLFCTKCEDTVTIDLDTHNYNYIDEVKDILNAI